MIRTICRSATPERRHARRCGRRGSRAFQSGRSHRAEGVDPTITTIEDGVILARAAPINAPETREIKPIRADRAGHPHPDDEGFRTQ
jgi:hypothetical protein